MFTSYVPRDITTRLAVTAFAALAISVAGSGAIASAAPINPGGPGGGGVTSPGGNNGTSAQKATIHAGIIYSGNKKMDERCDGLANAINDATDPAIGADDKTTVDAITNANRTGCHLFPVR